MIPPAKSGEGAFGMESRCPYCDKPIAPGSMMCANCGSYLVKIDERKRRWHLLVIPLVIIAATAALLVWLNRKADEVVAKVEAERNAPRVISPALRRQIEKEERERLKAQERLKSIKETRQKRLEAAKADEKWHSTPDVEKVKYLSELLDKNRKRITSLQEKAAGLSADELVTWLAKLESKVNAAVTFLEAGHYDQARGLLEGVRDELSELAPETTAESPEPAGAESRGPTAEPPGPSGEPPRPAAAQTPGEPGTNP